MDRDTLLRRLHFRAWHRGTREADMMIGGFCDRYSATWNDDEIAWFERLLEEQDVDIMGWAMDRQDVPAEFAGPMMDAMKRLDYLILPGSPEYKN